MIENINYDIKNFPQHASAYKNNIFEHKNFLTAQQTYDKKYFSHGIIKNRLLVKKRFYGLFRVTHTAKIMQKTYSL